MESNTKKASHAARQVAGRALSGLRPIVGYVFKVGRGPRGALLPVLPWSSVCGDGWGRVGNGSVLTFGVALSVFTCQGVLYVGRCSSVGICVKSHW